MSREEDVVGAFVELAQSLVTRFDTMEFLHVVSTRCVHLLGCAEAGMLICADDEPGSLRVLGSSSERAEALEALQALNESGPCVECYRQGEMVVSADLSRDRDRWPIFAAVALKHGVRAVHSLPMAIRGETLGVMNLFRNRTGTLSEEDARLAQGLADLAAIGLLHERTTRETHTVVAQLQGALDSRVVIEQAKGMLAAKLGIRIDEAFGLLRGHARSHNRLLRDVAREVVEESLDPEELVAPAGTASL